MTDAVRVRFAPSPTGFLHVGGARTAIHNWLYARKTGGAFILRIEDTDRARSSDEMVEHIVESMKWLGLDWDEGPFFQSRRADLYARRAAELRASGAAYPCYCTVEELAEKRKAAEAAKLSYKYDGTCRGLSPEKQDPDRPHVLRVRVPEGRTAWDDLVQGRIDIDNDTIEDYVLLRSDGTPTYHLVVVADDADMGMTHILRGVDHISNTPKQMLLYRALGVDVPKFGHLPLILGPDRKKLSKRHGITAVSLYREEGILPEALFNFLALLGWSPGDDRELMDRPEMIEAFDVASINKANAIFDRTKLDWMNAQYLGKLDPAELRLEVEKAMRAEQTWSEELDGARSEWLDQAIAVFRSRARVASDIAVGLKPFLSLDFPYDEKAVKKRLKGEELPQHLRALRQAFAEAEAWTEESTEQALRAAADSREIKAPVLIHALRVGLTGSAAGPSLFELVVLAGRDGTLARLDRLIEFVNA